MFSGFGKDPIVKCLLGLLLDEVVLKDSLFGSLICSSKVAGYRVPFYSCSLLQCVFENANVNLVIRLCGKDLLLVLLLVFFLLWSSSGQ